jgi:hypothetical protein
MLSVCARLAGGAAVAAQPHTAAVASARRFSSAFGANKNPLDIGRNHHPMMEQPSSSHSGEEPFELRVPGALWVCWCARVWLVGCACVCARFVCKCFVV